MSGRQDRLNGFGDMLGLNVRGSSQVGDITITYWTYGEGYPLVMIMGFSGTMDMWDPTVITELSAR